MYLYFHIVTSEINLSYSIHEFVGSDRVGKAYEIQKKPITFSECNLKFKDINSEEKKVNMVVHQDTIESMIYSLEVALKEMEKIYPNDKELIYNIGDICSHIGDNEESIKYLNRVLEIDTKSIRTLQHLCGVYSGLGDYTQMLTLAKNYVIYSGDFDSYRRISNAYIKLNDIDSGINELNIQKR